MCEAAQRAFLGRESMCWSCPRAVCCVGRWIGGRQRRRKRRLCIASGGSRMLAAGAARPPWVQCTCKPAGDPGGSWWIAPVRAGQHDGGSARASVPFDCQSPARETLRRDPGPNPAFRTPCRQAKSGQLKARPGGPLPVAPRRRRRRAALGAPALWQARRQGSVQAPKGPR